MEAHSEKSRSQRVFEHEDYIYLKVRPYIQSIYGFKITSEVGFSDIMDLYKILQRVGKILYKLELSFDAKIHLVVHVSLLKKVTNTLASGIDVSTDLSTRHYFY